MSSTVLHHFHAGPASLKTVPDLAERITSSGADAREVLVFGPVELMLANPEQADLHAALDSLVAAGVSVTTRTGTAQRMKAEAAFEAREKKLERAAVDLPRFAGEGATVISF